MDDAIKALLEVPLLGNKSMTALVAAVAFLLAHIVKGLYTVRKGHSGERKEFLEIWNEDRARSDDLWLEAVIRHGYGLSISADLIRVFLGTGSPTQFLSRIATSWRKFDMQDGFIAWKFSSRNNEKMLASEILLSFAGYFLFATTGSVMVKEGGADAFVIGGILIGLALVSLVHVLTLMSADSDISYLRRCIPALDRDSQLRAEKAARRKEKSKLRREWVLRQIGALLKFFRPMTHN
ncbi:hypothetical protein [Pseudoxanthomonas winnipegensis]|uniref:hypothetical protein n=1 Tax=Pseudoxanthomonas winnipegensis TaxID=2480810 RepID=UPI0030F47713